VIAMAFAQFDLKTAVSRFELSEERKIDLFAHVEPIDPSDWLRNILAELAPIASGDS
jgi:hypothetical protein